MMSQRTVAPEIAHIQIPVDSWTAPFWEGTAQRELVLPRCGACGRYRWPPGPFCPACQSQEVDWVPAGPGRIYSFTLVPGPAGDGDAPRPLVAPSLIEFPQAGGLRIVAAIVDTAVESIAIDAAVTVDWRPHNERNIPVFRIA